ncbi:glyoxalase I [Testicularia cyperi]|uniref:lactoylglutathione lyase n=1 Tax=Testicularia cyperi TaxID=1882483 RepID=A0A317XR64_9BASI|nr:glyoxalase I [Testicularia cyperi]
MPATAGSYASLITSSLLSSRSFLPGMASARCGPLRCFSSTFLVPQGRSNLIPSSRVSLRPAVRPFIMQLRFSPLFSSRFAFHSSAKSSLPPTPETASYRFNHTMIRVKDPKKSLDFYENVLGMDLIDTHKADDFTLYFLAYQHQKVSQRGEREAILELTHNHGTENDANFSYHNGNQEPKGFGHLCISVDDINAACERFEKLGVKFQKRLTDGKMRNIAFILDPDNYWIEVISTTKPQ